MTVKYSLKLVHEFSDAEQVSSVLRVHSVFASQTQQNFIFLLFLANFDREDLPNRRRSASVDDLPGHLIDHHKLWRLVPAINPQTPTPGTRQQPAKAGQLINLDDSGCLEVVLHNLPTATA